ncbi:MAG TPA: hypothetical protein VI914_06295, partial [Thermodesulfobacteriota bacterium]|nr:hypothetical protein [Thermodesulfobacteriota bacterium]
MKKNLRLLLFLFILVLVPSCSTVSSEKKQPFLKTPAPQNKSVFPKISAKRQTLSDAYYYFTKAQVLKKGGDLMGAV